MPVIVYVFHNPRDKHDYVSVGKAARPNDFIAEVRKQCKAGSLFGLQFAVDYSLPAWRDAIIAIKAYLAPNAFFKSWSGEGEVLDQVYNDLQKQIFNTVQDVTTNKQKGADKSFNSLDAYMRG